MSIHTWRGLVPTRFRHRKGGRIGLGLPPAGWRRAHRPARGAGGIRKGTNAVSTNGVTANISCFWYGTICGCIYTRVCHFMTRCSMILTQHYQLSANSLAHYLLGVKHRALISLVLMSMVLRLLISLVPTWRKQH